MSTVLSCRRQNTLLGHCNGSIKWSSRRQVTVKSAALWVADWTCSKMILSSWYAQSSKVFNASVQRYCIVWNIFSNVYRFKPAICIYLVIACSDIMRHCLEAGSILHSLSDIDRLLVSQLSLLMKWLISFSIITITILDFISSLVFIENATFRRLDSVSVFRWNILIWAQ
jgi:hypothetical protein